MIYFRHALTDPIPDDAATVDFGDCTTQRNLSAAGRKQSRMIGRAVGTLVIPVGRVLVSPYCRARATALLVFGKAARVRGLENLETSANEAERQHRLHALARLLSTPPPEGENTVLVAHGFNITGAPNIMLDEGDAAIFEPRTPTRKQLQVASPSNAGAVVATRRRGSGARGAHPRVRGSCRLPSPRRRAGPRWQRLVHGTGGW